tara:strand:+ start:1620 stop:1856 length:237 start_codon:yes stop_codon:yes gene_type:complete
MSAKYKARSGVSRVGDVSVKAETFWLELGHLRALVEAADGLSLPDEASVRLEGVRKHFTYVNEFTATTVHVSGVPRSE